MSERIANFWGTIALVFLLFLLITVGPSIFHFYSFSLVHPSKAMFYILAPLFLAVFYHCGKYFFKRKVVYFSLLLFGLLFYFGGVPYLYHPMWDTENQFYSDPNNNQYFGSSDYYKGVIEELNEYINNQREDLRFKRNDYKRFQDNVYLESMNNSKSKLDELYAKKKILEGFLKRVTFLGTEDGRSFMFERTRDIFKLHQREMLLSWIGLILVSAIGFVVGYYFRFSKYSKIDVIPNILVNILAYPFSLYSRFRYSKYETSREGDDYIEGIRFSRDEGAFLTADNLSLHTQVVGGSGVGKTNALKHIILSKVALGQGVIFMDFKADFEVMEWLAGVCAHFGRTDLKVLTLSDPDLSIAYNPLEHGNANELTSQMMNSLVWSEEYYRSYSESILLMSFSLLIHLRDHFNRAFHLGHLLKILTNSAYRGELLSLSVEHRHFNEISNQLLELDLDKNREKISGLTVQLKRLVYSEAGDIFTTNVEKEKSLNLRESIKNGEIVYLCMNSMSLKEVASLVGKLILQDLMKEVGAIYDTKGEKGQVSVVIDEFASFATPDFVHFIDKARGAGVELVLSHQSMADLKEVSDNFGTRIFENTASKIIFNTLSGEEAEFFASMIGTYEKEEITRQTERGIVKDNYTGMGSSRMVEKFIVHPNIFKNLDRGEAVISASKIDQHTAVVKIDRAPEIDPVDVRLFLSKEEEVKGRYLGTSLGNDAFNMSFSAKSSDNYSSDGIDLI